MTSNSPLYRIVKKVDGRYYAEILDRKWSWWPWGWKYFYRPLTGTGHYSLRRANKVINKYDAGDI